MRIQNLISNKGYPLEGIKVIEPNIFKDNRGFFYESWNKDLFSNKIEPINFIQENHSFSTENVLRGLHYQIYPNAQGKLVECIYGEIFDVVVDIRLKSKTFLQWGGLNLTDLNHKQIWIPKGFAHGFYTLSSNAHLIYKIDSKWDKNSERTINWNDKKLSINWPNKKEPNLSNKDKYGQNIFDIQDKDFL